MFAAPPPSATVRVKAPEMPEPEDGSVETTVGTAPGWLTVKTWPAMVNVPTRDEAPVFCATE